jgi:hypothetical protein
MSQMDHKQPTNHVRVGGSFFSTAAGRKWITTKAAVLRSIENTSTDDSLAPQSKSATPSRGR